MPTVGPHGWLCPAGVGGDTWAVPLLILLLADLLLTLLHHGLTGRGRGSWLRHGRLELTLDTLLEERGCLDDDLVASEREAQRGGFSMRIYFR